MRILVVGSGGREHALAWRLSQDRGVDKVFLSPGNAGAALEPLVATKPVSAADFSGIHKLCLDERIDFVVIGPDQALADGIVDYLQARNILAFGPKQVAARIEFSKAFAKECMQAAGIPTARFGVFAEPREAKLFLRNCGWKTGWAIKADGLALGKGVVVTGDLAEADAVIDAFLVEGKVGNSGSKLVIEERLRGREVSGFYICDGERAHCLGFACDYKQLEDGGLGPNTGGMGAFAPADWIPADFPERIAREVTRPLLQELKGRDAEFRGILFVGIMVTSEGPRVLEFNARFGDPETQALLPIIAGNLTNALQAAAKGSLHLLELSDALRLERKFSVHVALAAAGYPGSEVRRGDPIEFAPELAPNNRSFTIGDLAGGKLFFAGVANAAANSTATLETNGGRVLGVTALGATLEDARTQAYAAITKINFQGKKYRKDIGR